MVADLRQQGVSFIQRLCRFLGAERTTAGGYVLQTTLTDDELPSLWLALAADLLGAGIVNGIQECTVFRASFGLRVLHPAVIDLICCDGPGNGAPSTRRPEHLAPFIVLAGLPGSGKSTVRQALAHRLRTPAGRTYTTRAPRTDDQDFTTGRYRPVQEIDERTRRRGAAYSLPVRFRDNRYIFSLAGSIVARFEPDYDLIVQVDSHPLRIDWLRALMPDIHVIWLDATKATLSRREVERGSNLPPPTANYVAACAQTRTQAKLILDTDGRTPDEAAEEIIQFLGLSRRAS